jgi:hypothetical protein
MSRIFVSIDSATDSICAHFSEGTVRGAGRSLMDCYEAPSPYVTLKNANSEQKWS